MLLRTAVAVVVGTGITVRHDVPVRYVKALRAVSSAQGTRNVLVCSRLRLCKLCILPYILFVDRRAVWGHTGRCPLLCSTACVP